jgi:hypothetical protein
MTPHKIEQILNDIASEEVADDMNLWPDIRDTLKTIPAPRSRPILNLSRAVAAFAVILFAGTVYAVYQTVSRNGDPGIQAVSELITELDQSMEWSPKDVNVTLDWGYADGHRIAIGWTIDYPIELDLPMPTVTVLDRNGTPLKDAAFLYGGGGGGGGGGDRVVLAMTNSFDATGITGTPETLPLTIHFTFSPEVQGAGFGGGGGGGGSSTQTPPRQTITDPFRLMFDFELPFIPAEPVDGEFTAEANGVVMTIRDLTYAPSATLGKLCYETSWNREAYQPIFTLTADGIEYVTFAHEPVQKLALSRFLCGDLAILAPADPETGVLSFTVEWLESHERDITPETVEVLKTRVQEAGLNFDVSYDEPVAEGQQGGLRTSWQLGGSEREKYTEQYPQLKRLIAETMHSLIEGPWTFEIDVK